jgi:small subunit ribosomal protein S1
MDEERRSAEEGAEEESFEALLEAHLGGRESLTKGDRVEAVIVKITPEWAFLDLGGKSEGYLDAKELLDEDGKPTCKEGDTIQAYFLSSRNQEQLFTTRITTGGAARAFIEDAWRNGIPVEGMVAKEVKGGFEVRIAGNMRAFCPFSHMGLRRVADPSLFVGQRFTFKVLEYGEGGRKLIVSNRAILEGELAKQKESLKATLREGMRVRGSVASLRDFGAFVDLGGVQGLLPVSEVAWERVGDIRDALSEGQDLEVAILKLDWERDRITLSLKQTLPNPWDAVEERYPEGSSHVGKVVRLTKFGAFVALEPGVDGLIHISKLGAGKRIGHPREIVAEGQALEVKVESVDRAGKRLSLALPGPSPEEARRLEDEEFGQYMRGKTRPAATLGDLLKARLEEKGKL